MLIVEFLIVFGFINVIVSKISVVIVSIRQKYIFFLKMYFNDILTGELRINDF